MQGSLDIRFLSDAALAGTRLVHLDQRAPLRALFPHCSNMGLPVAAITTTCGGLTGGDHLSLAVHMGQEAGAMAVAQAAEKLYRSTGADTRIDVDLHLGANAWLEWLPQETILFDGARLRRRTRLNLGAGSAMLAGEMLTFGRQARGEELTHGLVRDEWHVARDGKPAWADTFHAAESDLVAALYHPAALAGARASAMLMHAGENLGAALALVRARLQQLNAQIRAAATIVNGILLVRWLGSDSADIRPGFAQLWMELRALARGLPANLPTFWHV
ncbi:urease accessory protein UreD [Dongia sp.]|uniref:urease accessory protein UreD n=1 Tax=Dongia sp. TaxID=1977262 RepID=UPI0035B3C324